MFYNQLHTKRLKFGYQYTQKQSSHQLLILAGDHRDSELNSTSLAEGLAKKYVDGVICIGSSLPTDVSITVIAMDTISLST